MTDGPEQIHELEYAGSKVRRAKRPFARLIWLNIAGGSICLLILIGELPEFLDTIFVCGRTPTNTWPILVVTIGAIGGFVAFKNIRKLSLSKITQILLLIGGSAIALFICLFLYNLYLDISDKNYAVEFSHRSVCSANLRQIYEVMTEYHAAYAQMPDSFESLYNFQAFNQKMLICPSHKGRNPGYRIVKTDNSGNPQKALVIDFQNNHWCEGGNVLWEDGQVDFLRASKVATVLSGVTFYPNP